MGGQDFFCLEWPALPDHTSEYSDVTSATLSDGAWIETEYDLADKVVAVRGWLGVTTDGVGG